MYIGFIDGEDWIEDGMYEYLMGIALKYDVDLVTSGYIEEGGTCRIVEDSLIEKEYRSADEKKYIVTNFLFSDDMQKAGMI